MICCFIEAKEQGPNDAPYIRRTSSVSEEGIANAAVSNAAAGKTLSAVR